MKSSGDSKCIGPRNWGKGMNAKELRTKRKRSYTVEYDDRTKIKFTTLVVGSCPAA